MPDPKDQTETQDLEAHINDVVEEAQKHGHSKAEVREALERAAEQLSEGDDDEDGA